MNRHLKPLSIAGPRQSFHRSVMTALALTLGSVGMATASTAMADGPIQRGVVIGVHPSTSSQGFIAHYHLPYRDADQGRFAVVKLIDGAWGEASFALVYVPGKLKVEAFDFVELDSPAGDVLLRPGQGIVARVNGGADQHPVR